MREDLAEKAQSFQVLVNAAYEIAVVASGNKELTRRAGFSRLDVGEELFAGVVAMVPARSCSGHVQREFARRLRGDEDEVNPVGE